MNLAQSTIVTLIKLSTSIVIDETTIRVDCQLSIKRLVLKLVNRFWIEKSFFIINRLIGKPSWPFFMKRKYCTNPRFLKDAFLSQFSWETAAVNVSNEIYQLCITKQILAIYFYRLHIQICFHYYCCLQKYV